MLLSEHLMWYKLFHLYVLYLASATFYNFMNIICRRYHTVLLVKIPRKYHFMLLHAKTLNFATLKSVYEALLVVWHWQMATISIDLQRSETEDTGFLIIMMRIIWSLNNEQNIGSENVTFCSVSKSNCKPKVGGNLWKYHFKILL